jgi:sporulation protein YlmC with PRC-barrel domain
VPNNGGKQEAISIRTVSTEDLIGAPVVDIQNVRVGRIKNLIVDLCTSCITAAVLSLEQSLVCNARPGCVVLPWKVLLLDRVDHTFVVDVDTDLLRETGHFAYYTYPSCAPC